MDIGGLQNNYKSLEIATFTEIVRAASQILVFHHRRASDSKLLLCRCIIWKTAFTDFYCTGGFCFVCPTKKETML